MNRKLLQQLELKQIEVDIVRDEELEQAGIEESELDAPVSYVSRLFVFPKQRCTIW